MGRPNKLRAVALSIGLNRERSSPFGITRISRLAAVALRRPTLASHRLGEIRVSWVVSSVARLEVSLRPAILRLLPRVCMGQGVHPAVA